MEEGGVVVVVVVLCVFNIRLRGWLNDSRAADGFHRSHDRNGGGC